MDFFPIHNSTEETKDSLRSKEVVETIVSDYNYLLENFKKLSEVSSTAGDKTTEAFADENVASLEKELWMLGNMIN